MCVCSSLVGFEDSTCSFLIAPSLVDSPPLESCFCEGVVIKLNPCPADPNCSAVPL